MFLQQRSSRGHSANEWPHHCQGVGRSERPLGQSWPGMAAASDSNLNVVTQFLRKYIYSNVSFHPTLPKQVSNLQYEMLLLTDSISKEGGCWELRLRCGKHQIPHPKTWFISKIVLYTKSFTLLFPFCPHSPQFVPHVCEYKDACCCGKHHTHVPENPTEAYQAPCSHQQEKQGPRATTFVELFFFLYYQTNYL